MGNNKEIIENVICNLNKIQVSTKKHRDIIQKAHRLLALLEDINIEDVKKRCKELIQYAIQYADTMSFLEDNDMYATNLYVQANSILDEAWDEINQLL